MKHILIIDNYSNEDFNLDSLSTDNNIKVHIAYGKNTGFDIATHYLPDLIICNLEVESDGFLLIEKLIHSELTRTIPIIYLSPVSDYTNQRKIINCGADDYLIKPVSNNDLILAIKTRLNKQTYLIEKMMKLCRESLEVENQLPKKNDHILITIGKRLQLIKFKHIVSITALKEYSKLRTFDGKKIIVRKSLKSWVDLLPAKGFLRIHRASIINIEAIEKIQKIKDRTYVVFLRSIPEPLELSQRYSIVLRDRIPS